MIAEDRSVPKNLIHSCSRLVDRRWIDEKSLYVSQLWKARLNFLLTNIDRAFDGVIKTLASASIEFIGDGREKQLTDIIFRRKYLESVDAQYHKLICSEIFSFLASSTGYLVFNKVCKLILLTELVDFAKTGKQASPQTIKNQITEMTDNYWIAAIQSSIIAIRWIDLINKRIK